MDELNAAWPKLDFATLRPTADTLQLFTQVVGKVRLARTPWINHSWNVTLYVSARGLTTSLIPGATVGLELEFDFIAGALVIRTTTPDERRIPLGPGSVADFYAAVMRDLDELGAPTRIDETPNEMPDAVPFSRDHTQRPYDPAVVRDFWRALLQIDRVFLRFRSRFLGKCSPIHFFWGSFDLAVTRFSGRRAPLHPGGVPNLPDEVTQEAYSHEVSSAGFWPGGGGVDQPAFYAYAYPVPDGFAAAPVAPAAARFDATLGEFLLPYEAVRTAPDPDAALLAFLQSTYEAAADRAGWDRAALECAEGRIGVPRQVG
ncbi:MAG TPA: DUF5996 family protein [Caulobacteraceae bacterium]|jgi:hypothetical protein|nr:DUF5996 family protein [Caulobacteraceae bacterium]